MEILGTETLYYDGLDSWIFWALQKDLIDSDFSVMNIKQQAGVLTTQSQSASFLFRFDFQKSFWNTFLIHALHLTKPPLSTHFCCSHKAASAHDCFVCAIDFVLDTILNQKFYAELFLQMRATSFIYNNLIKIWWLKFWWTRAKGNI